MILQKEKIFEVLPKDNLIGTASKKIKEKLEKVTKFVELPEKSGIAAPPIVIAHPRSCPLPIESLKYKAYP